MMSREGIRPERQEDEARDDERHLIKGEGRYVTVPIVERQARDKGSNTSRARKNAKHRTEYFAVRFETEIAADQEAHKVDLTAQSSATKKRAGEWQGLARAARKEKGADHRQDEKSDRNIRPMISVDAPA